ncbi:MAG: caspase family protein [Bacteroidota bacterium]
MALEREKALGSTIKKEDKAPVKNRTNHLFVIGIDEYKYHPKLHNCKRDCNKLIEVLTTKYDFSIDHVVKRYDAEATYTNILDQLETYSTTLGELDNLIVYFSGHGYRNDITDIGYWVPVEATKETKDFVPNSLIRDYIEINKAHHIFLILDSCFSGKLFSQFKSIQEVYDRMEADPSRWALTAGRDEVVTEGALGDHSPFAKSLIGFLDRTETAISTQLLCAKMVEAVGSNSGQLPRGEPLNGVGHQGGQFIFRRKAVSQSDRIDKPEELETLSKQTKEHSEKTPTEKVDTSETLDFIQKLELKGLIGEAEAWNEKLSYLRSTHAAMAEGAHKFQIKMEIRQTEKELAAVVEKIKAVQDRNG